MDKKRIKRVGSRKKKAIAATICIIIAAAALLETEHVERRPRMWWVRPWLTRQRGNIGLPDEFTAVDTEKYSNYLRMDNETFNLLLNKIKSKIEKNCFTRQTISAKDKLIITLRYLATGESFRSLMYNYRISESTISIFIPKVCQAIYEALKDDYLKVQLKLGIETYRY